MGHLACPVYWARWCAVKGWLVEVVMFGIQLHTTRFFSSVVECVGGLSLITRPSQLSCHDHVLAGRGNLIVTPAVLGSGRPYMLMSPVQHNQQS